MRATTRLTTAVLIALAMLTSTAAIGGSGASAATTRSFTWPSSWQSPLGTSSVTVTTNYGAYDLGCPNADRTHTYTYYLTSGRSEHLGLDLAAGNGADVFAIGDGRVLAAGNLWGSANKGVVLVEHMASNGNHFTAVYGHITIANSPIKSRTWAPGDVVRKGNKIGDVALAGTGYHLHFAIAPGVKSSVSGTTESSGTGNCVHQAAGTTNPESYLKARSHAGLTNAVVGYKNTNGSVTSWQVKSVSGVLRRYWVPTTTVYSCIRNKGYVDWGPMPAAFLNQLPDRAGYHASC